MEEGKREGGDVELFEGTERGREVGMERHEPGGRELDSLVDDILDLHLSDSGRKRLGENVNRPSLLQGGEVGLARDGRRSREAASGDEFGHD